MSDKPTTCPECEAWDTKRVHTERLEDEIEDVRICNECPAEYVVSWGDARIKEVRVYD